MRALILITGIWLFSSVPAVAAGREEFLKLADLRDFTAESSIIPVPRPRTHDGNIYYSSGCARAVLPAGPGGVSSAVLSLHSEKFREECHPLPPNDLGLAIEHCFSRPLAEWDRLVKVEISPRELPPGEEEVFEVCLTGNRLTIRPVAAFYAYRARLLPGTPEVFSLIPRAAGGAGGEKIVSLRICGS